jgi:hypothetical protein
MIRPEIKADQLYNYAAENHGLMKAKEESLKSANSVLALVPMKLKEYWEKVVESLNKK